VGSVPKRTKTRFINVDLDVRAKTDLAALVPAFEPGAYVLGCTKVKGGYFANWELAGQPLEPNIAIRRFVKLIEALAPKTRAIWNRASKREFSIGVEAGRLPASTEFALNPSTLKLAAGVGAGVVFVVYVREDGKGDGASE
jgi:hypothetical protein